MIDDTPGRPMWGTVWGRHQPRDELVWVNRVSVDLVKTLRALGENVFIRADELSCNIFIDGRAWASFVGHGARICNVVLEID